MLKRNSYMLKTPTTAKTKNRLLSTHTFAHFDIKVTHLTIRDFIELDTKYFSLP